MIQYMIDMHYITFIKTPYSIYFLDFFKFIMGQRILVLAPLLLQVLILVLYFLSLNLIKQNKIIYHI